MDDVIEEFAGNHTEVTIESLAHFLKQIPAEPMLTKRVVFRGQGQDHSLVPSLFRKGHACFKEGGSWISYEQTVLRMFENEAVPLLNKEPNNPTDWITLAQHHGVPTRTLDWTTSAITALYFAVKDVDKNIDKKHSGVIWQQTCNVIRHIPFKDYNELRELKEVKLFFPKHSDPRITAQSGCLTFHPLPEPNVEFSAFVPKSLSLGPAIKYIIPSSLKETLLDSLDDLGINAHSIYPDLDGLAKEIKHKISRRNRSNEQHRYKGDLRV